MKTIASKARGGEPYSEQGRWRLIRRRPRRLQRPSPQSRRAVSSRWIFQSNNPVQVVFAHGRPLLFLQVALVEHHGIARSRLREMRVLVHDRIIALSRRSPHRFANHSADAGGSAAFARNVVTCCLLGGRDGCAPARVSSASSAYDSSSFRDSASNNAAEV